MTRFFETSEGTAQGMRQQQRYLTTAATQPSAAPPCQDALLDRSAHGGLVRVNGEPPRVPGPLPTLTRRNDVQLPFVIAPSAQTDEASTIQLVSSPERLVPPLERLRHPLQVGFTVLLLLDLPFIVYVLCWHFGFDLTTVTYPLLTVTLGVLTVAIWLTSHRLGSSRRIDRLLARIRTIPWIALQVVPIVGFVLWRDGGLGRMNQLFPLFIVALAFTFSVALPAPPWAPSRSTVGGDRTGSD
jgi:hypothetical protein